jgi:hypothetical protein
MLIQQQQHFKRAMDIAVASSNDLVDGSHIIRPELHIRSPARIAPANIAGRFGRKSASGQMVPRRLRQSGPRCHLAWPMA